MIRARPLPLVALLLPWLVACGSPMPTVEQLLIHLDDKNPRVVDAAVGLLGDRAREQPDLIVPLLIRRLEAEHQRGRVMGVVAVPDLSSVTSKEQRRRECVLVSEQVRDRLLRTGLQVLETHQVEERAEVVILPPDDVAHFAVVEQFMLEALREPAGLTLRAEMPPPFTPTADRPVSPFEGDEAAYAAWLAEERSRLAAATADGSAYQPQDPRYALLRVVPSPEAGAIEAVPVRLPPAGVADLTEQHVILTSAPDRTTGTPAVLVVPLPEHAERYAAFLRAHSGLRLWLVAGGKAWLPTSLGLVPPSVLAFPVHGATVGEARARATVLAGRLAVPPFRFPVVVSILTRPTRVKVDTPAARALVRVGVKAEPALDALLAKDKAWEPLVDRLREALLRTEASEGR